MNQAEGRERHHLDVETQGKEGKPPSFLVGEEVGKDCKHTTTQQRSSSREAQEFEDPTSRTPTTSSPRHAFTIKHEEARVGGGHPGLGEQPPQKWTCAELKVRLMELEEEKGIQRNRGRAYTNLQMWTIRLNEAAKRKEDLKIFLREELSVAVNNNSTIAQLTKQGMEKIYVITTPSGSDPMGFGENSNMTYEEVKTQRADYCRWAIKTAKEGATGVRLGRFVRRLEMGDQDKNAMDTTRPAPPKMRSSTTVKKEEQDAQG